MANINNKPIQNIWGSDTTNTEPSTTADKQGILYGAEIVSKQLNGALNTLSNQVAFSQYSGGQYSDDLTYNVGNIVFLNITGSLKFRAYFMCINDNGGQGIQGTPPINYVFAKNENGIPYYNIKNNNTIDNYWEKIDYIPKDTLNSMFFNPLQYSTKPYSINFNNVIPSLPSSFQKGVSQLACAQTAYLNSGIVIETLKGEIPKNIQYYENKQELILEFSVNESNPINQIISTNNQSLINFLKYNFIVKYKMTITTPYFDGAIGTPKIKMEFLQYENQTNNNIGFENYKNDIAQCLLKMCSRVGAIGFLWKDNENNLTIAIGVTNINSIPFVTNVKYKVLKNNNYFSETKFCLDNSPNIISNAQWYDTFRIGANCQYPIKTPLKLEYFNKTNLDDAYYSLMSYYYIDTRISLNDDFSINFNKTNDNLYSYAPEWICFAINGINYGNSCVFNGFDNADNFNLPNNTLYGVKQIRQSFFIGLMGYEKCSPNFTSGDSNQDATNMIINSNNKIIRNINMFSINSVLIPNIIDNNSYNIQTTSGSPLIKTSGSGLFQVGGNGYAGKINITTGNENNQASYFSAPPHISCNLSIKMG